MTTSPAHQTVTTDRELCGIRALHLPRPGLTRLTLHVGVGWADETFATRGVTHVIEHLAMGAAPRAKFESNACVTAHRTSFWANGRPDQVATFLNAVAGALHDLPLQRLDREKGVLEAEAGEGGYGPHDAMLKMRFGNQGLGLAMFSGLGPRATDPDVVTAHARRWFVRENAVITVVGEVPVDLEIDLPHGAAPPRTFTETARPGSVAFDVGDPVLSFVAPDVAETTFALRAMATRLEDTLRHDRGLVYAVIPELVRLPGQGRVVAQLATQVAPDAAKEVAEEMAAELLRRAEVGATAEEIAEDLEWWDAAAADPDFEVFDLDVAAERALAGLPVESITGARARVAALEPDVVAAVVRDALGTVLLLSPRGQDPDTALPDGGSCSVSREMTTTPLRRRFRSPAPRGEVLGFGGDVVQHRDEDGDVHEIRFDECVGVGVAGRARLLFGARGCFIWIDPREFRGADALVRAVDEHLPATIRFDMDA